MKKIAVIALFATISLAAALPAGAQVWTGPAPGPTPDPQCQINCNGDDDDDGGTEVGEPFNPPKPKCVVNCESGDPGQPGKPGKPGGPGNPGGSAQAMLGGDCGGKLGMLRRVTPAQVAGVGSDSIVDIVPVCRSKSLAAVQPEVATLRAGIAGNEVLDQELGRKGYDAAHVVGVIVNGPAVTLYVHQL